MAELAPIVVGSQLAGGDWWRGARRAQQLVAPSFFLLAPYVAFEATRWQVLICAYLAVAVLAGLLANTLLGIWCGYATCATGTPR